MQNLIISVIREVYHVRIKMVQVAKPNEFLCEKLSPFGLKTFSYIFRLNLIDNKYY